MPYWHQLISYSLYPKFRKNRRLCYARKDLTDTLQTCFKVWRFLCPFSGSNLSAHATQNLPIHSISGNGRKQVKKVPAYATLLRALKSEVESLLNRIYISYNRRGHRAFAVFLLSFFIGMCRRAVCLKSCGNSTQISARRKRDGVI